MAMKEESTDFVLQKILGSKTMVDIDKVVENSNASFNKTFSNFFNEYLAANPTLKLAEIIKDSDIDKTYAYQMINGTKRNLSRDYVIALCYAARMNLDEVNHALIYTKSGQLYSKTNRDAYLIFAFSKNRKDHRSLVSELNFSISERGHEPLKISKGSN